MVKGYNWRPLERERVKALMSHDALEYARLCYELGIDPEDTELYEKGAQPGYDLGGLEEAVNGDLGEPLKKKKRSVSDGIYRKFCHEAGDLSINPFYDIDAKIRLLEEYFPNKGNTEGMTPRQIGSKFASMLTYAKRRMTEQTR